MARKASVRYWDSRGGYYCWHQGKQVLLAKGPDDEPDGPCYRQALAAFARLDFPNSYCPTFAGVVDRFLVWAEASRAAGTVRMRRRVLHLACAAMGHRAAEILTADDFGQWIAKMRAERKWGPSTVRIALVSVQACLRWAVEAGILKDLAFTRLEKPQDQSRGTECILDDAQIAAIMGVCRTPARTLLTAMRDTGARPGELLAAELRHFDPQLGAVVFEANPRAGEWKHKTARHGKARVIFLTGDTLEHVRGMHLAGKKGPIFLSGNASKSGGVRKPAGGWTASKVADLFKRLKRKTGIKGLMPYSFRHTFAVRWLRARRPIEALAAVMGTSVRVIERHYGHLAQQYDYLRRLMEESNGQGE